MKHTIITIVILAICSVGSWAQGPTPVPPPATPIPFALATPPPQLTVYPTVTLSAAQWKAAITAVPATPQNLLTLVGSLVKLPETGTFRGISVMILPNGSARIMITYGQ